MQRAEFDVAGGGRSAPTFVPNPRADACWRDDTIEDANKNAENAYRHEDMAAHWNPKACGVEVSTEAGQYFSGRQAALNELMVWLNAEKSDGCMRVVTGDPGSGKSAVLARLVVLEATDIIDAAIHAHGLTLTQLTDTLAEMTGVEVDDPASLAEALDIRKSGWRDQLPSSRDDAFAQNLERFGDKEQFVSGVSSGASVSACST